MIQFVKTPQAPLLSFAIANSPSEDLNGSHSMQSRLLLPLNPSTANDLAQVSLFSCQGLASFAMSAVHPNLGGAKYWRIV